MQLGKPVLSMPYDSYEVLSRSNVSRDAFLWRIMIDTKLNNDRISDGLIRANRILDVEMRLAMVSFVLRCPVK